MFNITDLDRIKSMEGGLQIKGKYMDIMPLLIKLLPHFSLFLRNVFFFFFFCKFEPSKLPLQNHDVYLHNLF